LHKEPEFEERVKKAITISLIIQRIRNKTISEVVPVVFLSIILSKYSLPSNISPFRLTIKIGSGEYFKTFLSILFDHQDY